MIGFPTLFACPNKILLSLFYSSKKGKKKGRPTAFLYGIFLHSFGEEGNSLCSDSLPLHPHSFEKYLKSRKGI
jgi:hypothetical protein